MKLLITGVCGFVGSTLARAFREADPSAEVFGCDTLLRSGSETNRRDLVARGVAVHHADLRSTSDIEALPPTDFVIDAAANPSVLAGIDGMTSSRQLVEHNLLGTFNLLEYCKRHRAGFVLLSTSRVYSIPGLSALAVEPAEGAFRPKSDQAFPAGISPEGVSEGYSTAPPVSLYGATKVASEALALEYGETFGFPVWINRCGVLAGAGQFGRADQGIYSFWINSWLRGRPLKYIGFDGRGHQVRDGLHPRDLLPLLRAQFDEPAGSGRPKVVNLSGGLGNSMSLAQLSAWCTSRFGPREVGSRPEARPFDIPWLVLDHALASEAWGWRPQIPLAEILEEIACHAEAHPDWLDLCG